MIETSQLRLYRPILADYRILFELWRNNQVRQFLGGIVANEEINKKLIAIQKHWDQYDFGLFSVFDNKCKKIIGLCGLCYSEQDIELSYMFFPEYWGKGIGTQAILACVYYGFDELKLEKIIAITQEANRGSWTILEKVGMHHTATISKFNANQRVYKLTKTEWLMHAK